MKACATIGWDGPCGNQTSEACVECKKPVCASCAEESWLNEYPNLCPECWHKVEL